MGRRPGNLVLCLTGRFDPDRYPKPTGDRRGEGCAGHTPSPDGYTQWHEWAAWMAKTHRQVRCPQCKLLSIWVPRTAERRRLRELAAGDSER